MQVEGQGLDVILLPGLACGPQVWDGLMPSLLSSHHRVHRMHIAGFDGSPSVPVVDSSVLDVAAALAAYIDREKLQAPIVIGHSLGGAIGLALAAVHPAHAGRLVVVDALPFYSLLFDPAATVHSAEPGARAFRDAWLAASPEQLAAMQQASAARLVSSAEDQARVAQWGRRSDRSAVAHAAYALAVTDLRPQLARIRVPTTVVYAHHPSYGPSTGVDAIFRAAYAGLNGVEMVRIDHSRHFVMLDQPEAFGVQIARLMTSRTPRAKP
mgnify:CR=1 FL=1